jgi:glycosyltransferase involved in cell wall biosynthesis
MRAHDVLAVPSLWLETGPLVAMEALALGVPVLGSRLGGIAELVEHGVTGWLEPPGDVARWSTRIAELARDPAAVAQAAERARAARMPESGQVAEAMLALYRAVPGRSA